MEIKLVMPCFQFWESYKKSFKEMDHEGLVDGMDWDGKSPPEKYFNRAKELAEGKNLGELVAASNFWIISDSEYVGRMSIRHELNEFLCSYGGHVGYEVKTSARRKGIAKSAFALAINFCKNNLKLTEILITCDDQNIPSIKMIEYHGGILREKKNDIYNRLSRYYIIEITP